MDHESRTLLATGRKPTNRRRRDVARLPESCRDITVTSCSYLRCIVLLLLAGCSETTGTAPATIIEDIGTLIEEGDVVNGARQIWELAEPGVDVAVTGVEGMAGDAAGLVETVSGVVDATLEQSVRGARTGIDTGYREGALAGALAGSVAGLLSGPWVIRHHTSFLATRETLDEEIAFQKEVARSLARGIAATQTVVARHRREIARLGEAHEEGLADIRAREETLTRIEADRRTLQAMIAGSERSIVVLEKRMALFRKAGLDTSPLEDMGAVRWGYLDSLRALEDTLVALVARAGPPPAGSR